MFRYILPFVLVFLVGCSTKVETDYDPAFSTKALTTFAIVHSAKEGLDTLDDERIREAITHEMQLKGFELAKEETADFHVTFQTKIKEDVPSNFSFGFGVGTYSSGVGTSVGTRHNVTNDKEKLGINMVDPKTNKTFWRAEVDQKRPDFKSPQERRAYFDKTVASMLKSFPAKAADSN
jgi:hypothetical protein